MTTAPASGIPTSEWHSIKEYTKEDGDGSGNDRVTDGYVLGRLTWRADNIDIEYGKGRVKNHL